MQQQQAIINQAMTGLTPAQQHQQNQLLTTQYVQQNNLLTQVIQYQQDDKTAKLMENLQEQNKLQAEHIRELTHRVSEVQQQLHHGERSFLLLQFQCHNLEEEVKKYRQAQSPQAPQQQDQQPPVEVHMEPLVLREDVESVSHFLETDFQFIIVNTRFWLMRRNSANEKEKKKLFFRLQSIKIVISVTFGLDPCIFYV